MYQIIVLQLTQTQSQVKGMHMVLIKKKTILHRSSLLILKVLVSYGLDFYIPIHHYIRKKRSS